MKVPSVGDILGDKLTAYAPNTTGIPYYKKDHDCSMEIIKQLYDIARLFDEVDNLEVTSRSFGRIAEVELSYRGLENNPKIIYEVPKDYIEQKKMRYSQALGKLRKTKKK